MKKRMLSLALALLMLLPGAARAETAEYIRFGSYPQTEAEATPELENARYDANGDAVVGGVKYRRLNGRYFVYEPILWEKVSDGLYLARDILDCQPYDAQESQFKDGMYGSIEYARGTSWEKCSIRSWLSGSFAGAAFSPEERAILADVSLLPFSEAQKCSDGALRKAPTAYAAAAGVETGTDTGSPENGSWLLQDISPIMSSAVCTVSSSGAPTNLSAATLVNAGGLGVVPCIRLTGAPPSAPVTEDRNLPVQLGAPWGEVISLPEEEAGPYLQNGWYRSAAEAEAHTAELINHNFQNSPAFSAYEPYVKRYATDKDPEILLVYPVRNLSGPEITAFLKPLVDAALTGYQRDYQAFQVSFSYDAGCGASWEEFRGAFGLGRAIYREVETVWTRWSGVVRVNGGGDLIRAFQQNQVYQLDINLQINGTCSFSAQESDYFTQLRALAEEARAYSDRPLGQLQYIRNYLAAHVVYDSRVLSNDPQTVLIGRHAGVCGSYANAVKDLCYVLGIPCLVVYGHPNDVHAWNRVFLENGWYDLDCTGIEDSSYHTGDGSWKSFDPAGFRDAGARADNVSFLWNPEVLRTEDSGSSYNVVTIGREKLAAMQEQFSQPLMNQSSAEQSGSGQVHTPAGSSGFQDVPSGAWYAVPVAWAVENGITAGTSSTAFSPDRPCTVGEILTFLWRAEGSPEPAIANPYTDVSPQDFYCKPALWWAERTGAEPGTAFGADLLCTRAMAASYLWMLAGRPEAAPASFQDVPAWYSLPVSWAVEQGITKGTGEASFSPDEPCTRGTIVTFLYRAMGK